jgi:hypothetical protein
MIITNITGEIRLPWEPGLLEWLQEHYQVSCLSKLDKVNESI